MQNSEIEKCGHIAKLQNAKFSTHSGPNARVDVEFVSQSRSMYYHAVRVPVPYCFQYMEYSSTGTGTQILPTSYVLY